MLILMMNKCTLMWRGLQGHVTKTKRMQTTRTQVAPVVY